ncbi:MAG: hypothetical protein ACREQY_18930, partial [Candidatus Binatia bacterium]
MGKLLGTRRSIALWLAVFVAATTVHAVPAKKDLERIDGAIAAGDWPGAIETCEKQVRAIRTDLRAQSPPAELLA